MFVTVNLFVVPRSKIAFALALTATRASTGRSKGLGQNASTKPTFTRVLGTSSARTFLPKDATWQRWAVLNCWPGEALPNSVASPLLRQHHLAVEDDPLLARWRAIADQELEIWMSPISVKGSWGGVNPFTEATSKLTDPAKWVGVTAALTRARIRPSKWVEFWRSSRPVAHELQHSSGLIAAIGIGEAPIGLQGTFSLWRTNAELSNFVQRSQRHRQVIKAATKREWYAEDLFARFAVIKARGLVADIDPSNLHLLSSS